MNVDVIDPECPGQSRWSTSTEYRKSATGESGRLSLYTSNFNTAAVAVQYTCPCQNVIGCISLDKHRAAPKFSTFYYNIQVSPFFRNIADLRFCIPIICRMKNRRSVFRKKRTDSVQGTQLQFCSNVRVVLKFPRGLSFSETTVPEAWGLRSGQRTRFAKTLDLLQNWARYQASKLLFLSEKKLGVYRDKSGFKFYTGPLQKYTALRSSHIQVMATHSWHCVKNKGRRDSADVVKSCYKSE